MFSTIAKRVLIDTAIALAGIAIYKNVPAVQTKVDGLFNAVKGFGKNCGQSTTTTEQ